jgi:RNA polymerase sigma factor (sigma-70 family)
VVTDRTLARARVGDEEAFRELTDPYRRELQLHCYRIVGSVQDAEDLLQETLLAAGRGLERFEGRASLRSWLYRIATNRCLNALRDRGRRMPELPAPPEPPEPTRRADPIWLEPYPDALLEGVSDAAAGPDARYETREAVALALRGRAPASPRPAARRARATGCSRLPRGRGGRDARQQRGLGEQRPPPGSLGARPPPARYGRCPRAGRSSASGSCLRARTPSPRSGATSRTSGRRSRAYGLMVLTLDGGQISAMTGSRTRACFRTSGCRERCGCRGCVP